MTRRMIFPFLFGLAGVAALVSLGIWQVQRLAWKEGILTRIETRIEAPPVALPQAPDPARDDYLAVRLTGRFGDGALRVLVSRKGIGAGYRLISPFDTGTRRVLVDRGFVPVAATVPVPPDGEITLIGNLHWPDDRTSSTPENDVAGNMWFARDIEAMADALGTAPLLVIARSLSRPEAGVSLMPVDTRGIPNNHLQYAITWFSLALVWAVMSGYLAWRNRARAEG